MFANSGDPAQLARNVTEYFSSDVHGAHGRCIGRDEARSQELEILDLEESQERQDAVLTLYHLSTIAFGNSPVVKVVHSSTGAMWLKNLTMIPKAAGPQQQ